MKFGFYYKNELERNKPNKFFFREKDEKEQQITLEFDDQADEIYFPCVFEKKAARVIIPT